jgi:glucoamylase
VSTAYIDGIQQLLNLTYVAVDIGQTYFETLNKNVVASGAPVPTIPVPKPYASPKGYSKDITDWLAAKQGSQPAIAKQRMFNNINIQGAALGTVIAAQSYSLPDYGYNWVRDSSLTMDVIRELYEDADKKSTYQDILFQYATSRAAEQVAPGLQTGLGEPKFYLNNTIFTGPWGRPQNDGPATAAITLVGREIQFNIDIAW